MPKLKPLILVVDDTEGTRYAVTRTLSKDGYRIVQAENGTEALRKVDEYRPDLVVLDIHLPDISGFEVCRRIKADPNFATTPILQISASYVTSVDKIHGLEGGADNYLTHPVEPSVLLATVKALLRFRQINEQLRENENRLNLALSVAEIGTWDYDFAESCFRLSDRICRTLEVPETLGARDLLRRFEKSDRRDLVASIRRAMMTPDVPVDIEARLKTTREGARWLRIRGIHTHSLIRSGQRDTLLLSGTALEITTEKTAETEIQNARNLAEQAREVAEGASRAKSQFLANMSHEIRTPLGVIMGFTDLLLDSDATDEDKKSYVGTIQRNASVLAQLIEEVLDLSKIEANRMAIESIPFSVIDLVREAVSLLQLKGWEKSLSLKCSFEGPLPDKISGDPTRFRQILMNLVGNALKFTERGGVEIRARMTSAAQIGIPVEIEVDIADTGIGIPAEKIHRLFEPFMQADSSMTRRFGGTGLGLMLSRQLARLMGGDLFVKQSVAGEGSVFTVRIQGGPFDGQLREEKNAEVAKVAAPSVTQYPPLPSFRVLLVEDSVDNQFMIRKFLGGLGVRVDTADNGEDGLREATNNHYDVVLMDLQMPVMDGYQATSRLREIGFKNPIIALTAHALKGERERCLQIGFSDYLTKPLKRDALYEKLAALSSSPARI